jgi:hypothetical protein
MHESDIHNCTIAHVQKPSTQLYYVRLLPHVNKQVFTSHLFINHTNPPSKCSSNSSSSSNAAIFTRYILAIFSMAATSTNSSLGCFLPSSSRLNITSKILRNSSFVFLCHPFFFYLNILLLNQQI